MKRKRIKQGILFSIFAVLIGIFSIALIEKTKANEYYVDPGSGTLKDAVDKAHSGDTIYLRAGSYSGVASDRTVEINKALTIKGVGNSTIINVPIKITAKNSDEVNLSDYACSMVQIEPNFIFIQVDSEAKVNIDNVILRGILRADDNTHDYPIYDAKLLDVTNNADGAEITVSNSELVKPGAHYGIDVNASNIKMTLNKTKVTGRAAVRFNDGQNNTFNVNNSKISGPSLGYKDNETIVINKQDGLNMNINNSTIIGSTSSKRTIKIFSYSGGSKNVNINIQNGSKIIDEEKDRSTLEDKVFAFENDSTSSYKNTVKVDKSSSLYISILDNLYLESSTKDFPIETLYSKLDLATVVGIFDKDGNEDIQIYNNDSPISTLKDKDAEYNVLEGYRFKGWFTDKDYKTSYEKEGEDYPLVNGNNMNLYPKLVKLLNVTIKDVPTEGGAKEDKKYILEEGQSLSESENIEEIKSNLEKIKIKENTTFRGFVVHNTNGSVVYEDIDKLITELKMSQDCEIEAVHQIAVTINEEEPFYIEAGENLQTIIDNPEYTEKYQEAKMKGADGREFSRFVNDEGKTVTEEEGIVNNISLTSKYLYNVTIKDVPREDGTKEDKTYPLEEDLTLNSSEEIKTALESIKPEIEGRTFDRYVDSDNTEIDVAKAKINKNMTVNAVYTVEVKFEGKTETKTYTIDADTKLSKSTELSEIKLALDDVEANVPSGKSFDGFVLSRNIDSTNTIFKTTDYTGIDKLKEAVLDQVITHDTTIYSRHIVEVKIGKETFRVESGASLKSAILDSEDADLIEKYNKVKYGEKSQDPERFSKYVIDGKDTDFLETDEIQENMTLVPKYFAFVTIEDERANVKGKYKVEEGKSINELTGTDLNGSGNNAEEALVSLRSDISPTEENLNGDNLHFEKLVISETGEEISLSITEDIKIKALYHYDVMIVEDYDNPVENSHEDTYMGFFKANRNQKLVDFKDEIQTALNKLKTTATNTSKHRKFSSYYEQNTGIVFTDENLEEFLNKAYNKHLYITAKVSYGVKVDGFDEEFYVEENSPIKSNPDLLEAIQSLDNNKKKELRNYLVNDSEIDIHNIGEFIISEYTQVSANYNVNITIGENGNTYAIEEGKSLSSLDSPTQQKIRDDLEKLQEKAGMNFNGYSVDGETIKEIDDVLDHNFNESTTIVPIFNIVITIDGQRFELNTGESLKQIDSTTLDNIKNQKEPEQVFLKFVDENGNEITEDYAFTKNADLKTVYAYKVTIGEAEYKLEVNTALDDNPTIKAKLDELMNKEDRVFVRFVDADNNIINRKDANAITKHTTIKAIYGIKISINGKDFIIDEGSNLNSYNNAENPNELTDYLDSLEEDREDFKYVIDSEELTREELLAKSFDDNTIVDVKYSIAIETEDGTSYSLTSGQTLEDFAKKYSEIYNGLKINGKRNFSRFVDQNGKTLKEDEPIYENTTIIPKFNINITIFRKDEEGNEIEEDTINIELGEDLAISELTEEENSKLLKWIDEIEKKLEKEGKSHYVFAKFIDEEGNEIDINNYKFSKDAKLEAVFAYKEEETPVNPEKTEGNNNYPLKEKAPNTAVYNQEEKLSKIIYSIIAIVVGSLSIEGCRKYLHKNN